MAFDFLRSESFQKALFVLLILAFLGGVGGGALLPFHYPSECAGAAGERAATGTERETCGEDRRIPSAAL